MTNNIKETIKVTHISIQVDNLLGIKLPPKHHCYFLISFDNQKSYQRSQQEQ